MSCEEYIRQVIEEQGPVSFRDYMDICLYHPRYGYYTKPGAVAIGTDGDFYTSPGVTPLFGQLLARQVEEMWLLMGRKEFSIIEYGGAGGKLCRQVLAVLAGNKELYEQLRYYIIDPSVKESPPFLHEKLEWRTNSKGMGKFSGCILSNELIDNLPVHRVVMKDRLYEIYVDANENGFHEVLFPANSNIVNYIDESGIHLSPGFTAEINLDALRWIEEAAGMLEEGFVITIDYGFNKDELYSEHRREGTLTCYYRHSINHDPYIHAGEQDITAHINFSALVHWGRKKQLEFTGYTTQQYFLRSLGLASPALTTEQNDRKNSFLIRFLAGFSNKMKVLVQQKNMERQYLRGLALGITDVHRAGLL